MSDLFTKPRFTIEPIGSLHTGYGLKRDGIQIASHPSPLYLGALLEALLKGADNANATLVARTIFEKGCPTYEERLEHFSSTGPWQPARDPFAAHK